MDIDMLLSDAIIRNYKIIELWKYFEKEPTIIVFLNSHGN